MPQRDISTDHFSGNRITLKSTQSVDATTYARFQSIATLDTYLLGQGFTQATLDKMTKNDKIMEARRRTGSAVDASK